MPTLYVTEPGSVVRRAAGSIVVTLDEVHGEGAAKTRRRNRLMEVEPHRLELISLVGRAHITAEATHLCLEQGIAIAWFRTNGDFVGKTVPELSRTADLRLAQFRMAEDESQSLPLARTFVWAKVHNAVGMLAALRSNRHGQPRLGTIISELKAMVAAVMDAPSMDTLLGHEGDAARRYFIGLRSGFSGDIGFAGRVRRPATDPANALLSFCYVLVTNALASLLEARGFDPYMGFMHAVRSGRPSLALDLLEELRHPVVDRFVLRICNLRQLRPEHFEADPVSAGVRLKRDGMRTFFRLWAEFMRRPLAGVEEEMSPEELLRRQADRLADHVRGRERYRPLLLRAA